MTTDEMKKLREQGMSLAAKIRERAEQFNKSANGEGDLPADWQENWDKLNKDYDALSQRIEVMERAANVEALTPQERAQRDAIKRPSIRTATDTNNDVMTRAIIGWFRSQVGDPTDEEFEAMQTLRIRSDAQLTLPLFGTREFNELQILAQGVHPSQITTRAMSAKIGEQGGFAVSPNPALPIETAMLFYGSVMSLATVLRTANGGPIPLPMSDDTTNKGAIVDEDTDSAESAITFKRRELASFKFTSLPIFLPTELMQDAGFDIQSWVEQRLGERVGRGINEKFTLGTGANEPFGVYVEASTTNADAGFDHAGDQLLDLVYSVDLAYRNNGAFMCHDTAIKAIRKIKDANNAYIWQSGLSLGQPDSVLGYRIYANNDVPAIDGNLDAPVLFGDFSKYIARMVNAIRIEREAKAVRDGVIVVAYARVDGLLADAGTKPLKKMVVDFTPPA